MASAPVAGSTVAAFLAISVIGGSNAVAIRLGSLELAPFWGASLRFVFAGMVLAALAALLKIALPRPLVGAAAFGSVQFGLGYAFLYWGLQEANAATAQTVLALTPLATFLLAVAQRIEPFRWLGLAGAILAGAGVVWLSLGSAYSVTPGTLLILLGSTVCFAQAGIIVKRFPAVHPVAANAVAMTTGGVLLLALSMAFGENWTVPAQASTWLSLIYLIVVGSIGLFLLVLFVLHRWTASASSYSLLLMPLMTMALGALILDERITPSLIWGGILVIVGVYVGAFVRSKPVSAPGPASGSSSSLSPPD